MFSPKVFRSLSSLSSFRRFVHLGECRNEKRLIDSWDLMTGTELYLAREWAKGNKDPFSILPQKRGPGTKECPNVIKSFYDKRLVGCLCHPDSCSVVYFWVYENFPRRCNCNHWFVLERFPIPRTYEDCD